jgi:hypothetical protein
MPKVHTYSRVAKNKKLKKYLPHIIIVLVALVLTIPLLTSQNLLLSLRQSEKSNAAVVQCQSQLSAAVSNDGKSPSSSISVPRTSPRYYVHATANGAGCSTQFEINFSYCALNGTNCTAPSVISPFGPFRSNSQGIARFDLTPFKIGGDGVNSPWSETTAADGLYKFQYRPYLDGAANSIPWSNQISVSINNNVSNLGSTPPDANMQEYIVYRPGDTFMYNSTNITSSETYISRLQLEQERKICGVTVTPWRFTKNNMKAYWEPYTSDGFRNLRWMITSPSFVAPGSSQIAIPDIYNQFIWGLRDKIYNYKPVGAANIGATDNMALRDIVPSTYNGGLYYGSRSRRLPSYGLSQKTQRFPFVSLSIAESNYLWGDWSNPVSPGGSCPSNLVNSDPNQTIGGSWMYRTERDSITTPAGTFSDVARVDYYENTNRNSTNPFSDDSPFLRESWYFAKGVGLVGIKSKLFNGVMYNEYGVANNIAKCSKDSDCFNDTIEQPFVQVLLTKYTPASTQFNAQVARDSASFTTNITTTPSLGYYVKVTPAYTGYLEVLESNSIAKWVWAENGIAKIDLPASISRRNYTAQVRIWAPNETFDNEQLIGNYNAPWSNQFTVTVADTLPNQPPVGNLESVVSPSANQVQLSGWAYDSDDLSKPLVIKFYEGTSLLGQTTANIARSDVGAHGFSASLSGISSGPHTINAVALDNVSGVSYAIGGSPKSVTVLAPVQANRPPTGSLNIVTSPTYNTINIQGTASDPDTTTPVVVKIYDNGVLSDTTTGVTFNRTLTNRTAGAHTIKVVALDGKTSQEYEITGSPKTVTVSNAPVTVVPQPVTALRATCNTTGTTAQVSWNPSVGATSYLFRADRQSDGWSGVCPLNNPNGGDQCTSNMTPTNFTLTTNPNTPYNVWVHASNSAGNSSPVNIAVNCSVNRLPVGVLNNVSSPAANSILVQATANDPDTANPIVMKVYDNSVLVQTLTTLNLNTTLTNRTAGSHSVKVTATDAQTGQEVELSGSPKTVTVQNLATIAPTPTPTAVPTATPVSTLTNFTVLAAGGTTPGLDLPIFELRYRDTVVGVPTRTTSYMATYNFNVPTSATIGDFKVVFTNDYSSSANGTYVDRDLRVDSVSFKGITYRSDAAATYSTGTWTSSTGCAPGYKASVWLHCNGYFQYGATPIGPVDPVRIQAESYTQTTGQKIDGFAGVENKGTYIMRFDLGDTVSYPSVNLSGKTSVTFNYKSRYHGGYIEVRQDSTSGPVIGKIYTGQNGYTAFTSQTVSLNSGLSGSHTIHLVARDAYGVADIDWFEFK